MSSWLSRFNPTPSFPPHTGPYHVGTVDFELAASDLQSPSALPPLVSTLAFRCFYPCTPPPKPAEPAYWVQSPQKSILSAYARFLGASSAFANVAAYFPRLLYWIELPAHRDAPPLPSPHENQRWPVLVFSHGLAGSRNSYSHLCASLASYGLVVIAPEHRDGSCPVSHVRATSTSPAGIVDYRLISRKASPEAHEARDQQLQIRLWELSQIYLALTQMNSGQTIENLAAKDSAKPKKSPASSPSTDSSLLFHNLLDLDTPGAVSWAGHSFGAATTVQFVKSVFYANQDNPSPLLQPAPSKALKSQIAPQSPTILLDLWSMPLNSPSTASLKSKPMPCFAPTNSSGGASTIAILSEAFANWLPNLHDVKATLSDPLAPASSSSTNHQRPAASIFYPLKSAHLSQSDFGILFPRLTKYVAKADDPARTLRLNVRAVLQVLRNARVPVAPTSVADLELGGDVPAEAAADDWQILSRDEGAVRGWVAVRADDDVQSISDGGVDGRTEMRVGGQAVEAGGAAAAVGVEVNSRL